MHPKDMQNVCICVVQDIPLQLIVNVAHTLAVKKAPLPLSFKTIVMHSNMHIQLIFNGFLIYLHCPIGASYSH